MSQASFSEEELREIRNDPQAFEEEEEEEEEEEDEVECAGNNGNSNKDKDTSDDDDDDDDDDHDKEIEGGRKKKQPAPGAAPVFSKYNKGKGFSGIITFALAAPQDGGRRKAKPPPTAKSIAFSEKWSLVDFITHIHQTADEKYKHLFIGTTIRAAGPLISPLYSLVYKIDRVRTTPVSVTSKEDYTKLVDFLAQKPKLEVKWEMSEIANKAQTDSDEENQSSKKQKRKQHIPSPEEEEQNDIIKDLKIKYKCNDRSCGTSECFVHASGRHIKLTHAHYSVWAAAISGGHLGVDKDSPPSSVWFDSPDSRGDAHAGVFESRKALAARNTGTQVHVNFQGLAEAMSALRGAGAGPVAQPVAPVAQPVARPAPQQMSTRDFCQEYNLTMDIEVVLGLLKVSGPHTLEFVGDEHFLDRGLSVGEIADLRYAEKMWRQV